MIRINLMPVRQVRKVQARRRQFAVLGAVLAVELIALFIVHENQASALEERRRAVSELQGEIEQLKQEVGDFDKLKQQRDQLVAQREVINSLQKGRTGPVAMLRELSGILSVGKGPMVDQTAYEALLHRDPGAGYNPRWNPRRLWVERIDEARKQLTILGKAKDHDDVAELLKRLALSKFFTNVQLKRDDQIFDDRLKLRVVRFSLTCAAKY
ncbi:MAG: PilN domain-containing protein [Proteobacteria bacterium]|nr:PilN domain-containing protein [Pseudomonadota bacterium]